MKYLKKFESKQEKGEDDLDTLKKLINSTLAYLTDDGFEITYNASNFHSGGWRSLPTFGFKPIATVTITKCRLNEKYTSFKWDDMKYDLLPLLELINNEYKLLDYRSYKDSEILIQLMSSPSDALSLFFSIESVLNDLNLSAHNLGKIEFKIDLS